jgi:DoxX-like protein
MRNETTKTFQRPTDEKSATVARTDWNWSRIRLIAFWVTTFVIVFELAAGSVWNLLTIEWIEIQMRHLGYPHYFAYISGWWQAAAAVAIIAPRLPLLKEWAYAGIFFLWSGAAASHLSAGDSLETWWTPLMFLTCGIASWALRPADRRLPGTRFRRDHPADAGQGGAGTPQTRARAWAIPIGILVVLYAISFLTLPVVEDVMHEQAVELGWIGE